MDECKMTITEISNLIDWLKKHGCTDKEVTDCIQYIADTKRPKTEKEAQ